MDQEDTAIEVAGPLGAADHALLLSERKDSDVAALVGEAVLVDDCFAPQKGPPVLLCRGVELCQKADSRR